MAPSDGGRVQVIRFFADTGAGTPLWTFTGTQCERGDLPLSDGLWSDLEAWTAVAGWPDNYLGKSDLLKDLQRDGKSLRARTAEELGPKYVVRWDWQA
jgi:hypothetical protein